MAGTVDGPSVDILASPDGSVTGHVDPVPISEPDREATSVCKGVSVALSPFANSSSVEPITLVSMVDRGFFERAPSSVAFFLCLPFPFEDCAN